MGVTGGKVQCQHHEDPLLCPHVSPLPPCHLPPLLQVREVPARLLQVSLLLQISPGQDPEQRPDQLCQLLALQGTTCQHSASTSTLNSSPAGSADLHHQHKDQQCWPWPAHHHQLCPSGRDPLRL